MANLPILSDEIPDLGGRAPTTDDIIGWLKEQAFAAGKIGFSNVFQPEKFSELFALDPRPDTSPTYRVPTVQSAMEFGHGQWEREQWILKTMHKYQHVVKEAAVVLDKRLLAAGMSEKNLAAFKKKTSSPLVKVIELYKLENPPPKGPARVMVKIVKQTDKGIVLQEAYLSVEDTLDDLYPVLDSLSAYMDGRGERIANQAKGPWMYQLVDRGPSHKTRTQRRGKSPHKPRAQAPTENPRKHLRVDADWKDLARLLRKEGGTAPFAMLCQESTVEFEQTRAAEKEKEDEVWNVLDEDGKPYFQEVDWEKLVEKKFGKLEGPKPAAKPPPKEPTRRSSRLMSQPPATQG